MCLGSILPAGKEKINQKTKDFIHTGVQGNGDGSGVAIKKSGETRIHFKKGFRTTEAIIAYIESISDSINDVVMIHHRIGTQGVNNVFNMHPFVVSQNGADICQTEGITNKPMLIHNGMFSGYKGQGTYKNPPYFSDTYYFTKDFMATPEFLALLQRNVDEFNKHFSREFSGSRVAVMFPNSTKVRLLGGWIEDDGYFHSNQGFGWSNYRNVGGEAYYADQEDYYNPVGASILSQQWGPKLLASRFPKIEQEDIGDGSVLETYKEGNKTSMKIIKGCGIDEGFKNPLDKDKTLYPSPLGRKNMIIDDINCYKFTFTPKINHKLSDNVTALVEYKLNLFNNRKHGYYFLRELKMIEGKWVNSPIRSMELILDNCVVNVDKTCDDADVWEDYLSLWDGFSPTKSSIKRMAVALSENITRLRMRLGKFTNIHTIAVIKYAMDNAGWFEEYRCKDLLLTGDTYIKLLYKEMEDAEINSHPYIAEKEADIQKEVPVVDAETQMMETSPIVEVVEENADSEGHLIT